MEAPPPHGDADILPGPYVDPVVVSVPGDMASEPCDVQHLEQSLNIFRTRLRKRNERIAELEDINSEIERDLEHKEESVKRLRTEVATLRDRNIEMKRVAESMVGFDEEALRLRTMNKQLSEGLRTYCENSASVKVCKELCCEVNGVIAEIGDILRTSDHHVQLSNKIFAWYLKEEQNKYSKIRLSDYIYHEITQLKTDLEQSQKVNGWITSMQRPRPEDAEKIARLTEELKVAKKIGVEALAKVAALDMENKRLTRWTEVHMN